MSDRYRCLECGHDFCTLTRWLVAGVVPPCPACRSLAVERVRTWWRTLRDAVIVTNAA